jgi:predicted GIY-YIG superfamily endonuclease
MSGRRGDKSQVRTLHRARLLVLAMFYTYVLRCRDGDLYVGSALDLRKRLAQHPAGRGRTTAYPLPVTLEDYEACRLS